MHFEQPHPTTRQSSLWTPTTVLWHFWALLDCLDYGEAKNKAQHRPMCLVREHVTEHLKLWTRTKQHSHGIVYAASVQNLVITTGVEGVQSNASQL
jgi:hypothetical protein